MKKRLIIADSPNFPYQGARSRKEARKTGALVYFTGKPCKRGHFAERTVKHPKCPACHVEYRKRERKRNRESYLRRTQAWRQRNPEKVSESGRRSRKRAMSDPIRHEHIKENDRKRHANRSEAEREKDRRWARLWKKNNKDKVSAAKRMRLAVERTTTPSWVDKKELRKICIEASALSRATGIKYVVDHMVPLRGANVCGLNVPWNLRIITDKENVLKHNHLIEELALHPTIANGLLKR